MWPNRRLTDLFKIEHPIVEGPMAGRGPRSQAWRSRSRRRADSARCRVREVLMNEQQMRDQVANVPATRHQRSRSTSNFCHVPPVPNNAREHAWRDAQRTAVLRPN